MTSEIDTRYFDDEFTAQSITITPPDRCECQCHPEMGTPFVTYTPSSCAASFSCHHCGGRCHLRGWWHCCHTSIKARGPSRCPGAVLGSFGGISAVGGSGEAGEHTREASSASNPSLSPALQMTTWAPWRMTSGRTSPSSPTPPAYGSNRQQWDSASEGGGFGGSLTAGRISLPCPAEEGRDAVAHRCCAAAPFGSHTPTKCSCSTAPTGTEPCLLPLA